MKRMPINCCILSSEKFQAVVIGYTAYFIAGTSNGKIFLLTQTDFAIVERLRW